MSAPRWSFSRHRTFHECRRRYWLNYHAAALGAAEGAPERLRELRIQKYLMSRPQWVGNIVHDAAQAALEGLLAGELPAAEAAAAAAVARANSDISASEQGAWRRDPRAQPGFQEHYYGTRPWEPWSVTLEDISTLVHALYAHPIFRRITQVPERLVEVEELVEVELGGVPVRVRLDALIRDGSGGMVVIDWKTGRSHRPEELRRQLAVYGLYVRDRHGASSVGIFANIRLNTWGAWEHDGAFLEQLAAFIGASWAEMCAADPPEQQILEVEERFAKLPGGSRQCRWCPFRRDCGRA